MMRGSRQIGSRDRPPLVAIRSPNVRLPPKQRSASAEVRSPDWLPGYERDLPRRTKLRGSGLLSADYVADEVRQVRFVLVEMKAESLPAADLTPTDVRKLLAGTTSARARFGALSRFLDWCQDAGHIQANPCALIARSRRPKAPQARSHYLTPAELARLWHAAERLRRACVA